MIRAHHVCLIALTVLALTAYGLSGERPAGPAAPEGARTQSIPELKTQVDKLLASGDSVMIRRSIKDVFALVDGLIKSGQENDAFKYLSAALTHDSWALDYQLLLAEMLLARGQSEPARQGAVRGKGQTDQSCSKAPAAGTAPGVFNDDEYSRGYDDARPGPGRRSGCLRAERFAASPAGAAGSLRAGAGCPGAGAPVPERSRRSLPVASPRAPSGRNKEG